MTDEVQSFETPDYMDSVEFVDAVERDYFAEAQLGQQVYDFLNSPAGRYLHGRAKIQFEDSKSALMELDFTDPDSLAKAHQLKTDALTGQQFMRWCAEALENGENAEKILKTYRQSE